jgi:hypothetical protein
MRNFFFSFFFFPRKKERFTFLVTLYGFSSLHVLVNDVENRFFLIRIFFHTYIFLLVGIFLFDEEKNCFSIFRCFKYSLKWDYMISEIVRFTHFVFCFLWFLENPTTIDLKSIFFSLFFSTCVFLWEIFQFFRTLNFSFGFRKKLPSTPIDPTKPIKFN